MKLEHFLTPYHLFIVTSCLCLPLLAQRSLEVTQGLKVMLSQWRRSPTGATGSHPLGWMSFQALVALLLPELTTCHPCSCLLPRLSWAHGAGEEQSPQNNMNNLFTTHLVSSYWAQAVYTALPCMFTVRYPPVLTRILWGEYYVLLLWWCPLPMRQFGYKEVKWFFWGHITSLLTPGSVPSTTPYVLSLPGYSGIPFSSMNLLHQCGP